MVLSIENQGYFTLSGNQLLDNAQIEVFVSWMNSFAYKYRKILKGTKKKKKKSVVDNIDGKLFKSGPF